MPTIQRTEAIAVAMALQQQGRLVEAASIYRQILAREPQNYDALHLLGVASAQQGKHAEAVELIEKAIFLKPSVATFHANLGLSLRALRKLREATQAFKRALALKPDDLSTLINLAQGYQDLREPEKALTWLQRAVQQWPAASKAHAQLGQAYRALGRLPEAVAAHRSAAAIEQGSADLQYQLGNALRDTGRLTDAEAAYRSAIALSPDHAAAHNNLGNTLRDLGRLPEAIDAYEAAVQRFGDHAPAWSNLAISYQEQGRLEEAMKTFDRALSLDPSSAPARLFRAMLLLLRGEMELGWLEYEWRLKIKELYKRAPPNCSPWDGTDLTGKTLLVQHEQGFGDTLMFARFLRPVSKLAARIILVCQNELRTLLAESFAGHSNISVTSDAASGQADLYLPLMSAPFRLGPSRRGQLAMVPYLTVGRSSSEHWRRRLEESCGGDCRIKVGLVWAGKRGHKNDRNRSISPSILAPLKRASRVRFISLQKAPQVQGGDVLPFEVSDLTAELNDFRDTAALLMNLDLVISVDTAVAHLAGALGRPVWTLLPFAPDWRWLTSGDRSEWYPTMKLYRQTEPGDWNSAIERVVSDLMHFCM